MSATLSTPARVSLHPHTKAIFLWPAFVCGIVFLSMHILKVGHPESGWTTWTYGLVLALTVSAIVMDFRRDMVLGGGIGLILVGIILYQGVGLAGFQKAFNFFGRIDSTGSMLIMGIMTTFIGALMIGDLVGTTLKYYYFDAAGLHIWEWGAAETTMSWTEIQTTVDDTSWEEVLLCNAVTIRITTTALGAPIKSVVIENVINGAKKHAQIMAIRAAIASHGTGS